MSRLPFLAAAAVPLVAALALGNPTASAVTSATSTAATAKPAAAGSGWHLISTGAVNSLDDLSAVTTPDGIVHAFYTKPVSGGPTTLEHTTIGTGATPLGHTVAATLANGMAEVHPAMITPTGGLRVAFAGLGDGPSGDGRVAEATSDATGAAWATQSHALTQNSSAYAGYGIGATLLSNGTPVTATTLNSQISWRVGAIETTDPNLRNTAPADNPTPMDGCCMYHTTLVNSGDAVWMAWYQNGGDKATSGTFVQQVYPTAGPVQQAPGSWIGDGSHDPNQTIAMVARPGGGVVLAYGVGKSYLDPSVGLWTVGSSSVVTVPGSKDFDRVSLAATSSGRLWVGWQTEYGEELFAARTGTTGLTTGDPVSAGAPAGSSSQLRGMTIAGDDDHAILMTVHAADEAVYAAQVFPGLTLSAKPAKVTKGQKKKVTFVLNEGGQKLAGVKVTLKGAGAKGSCTTKGNGTCSIKVKAKKSGAIKVTATKPGFTKHLTKIKVKK